MDDFQASTVTTGLLKANEAGSPDAKPNPRYHLAISVALAPLIAAGLIWFDNRDGFRNAEAFVSLFAAVLSFYSLLGILATLWLQRSELRLQRRELELQRQALKLQRDEMARIATANEQQFENENARKTIEFQRQVVEALYNYLSSTSKDISRELKALIKGEIAEQKSWFERFLMHARVVAIRLIKADTYLMERRIATADLNIEVRCCSLLGFRTSPVLIGTKTIAYEMFLRGLLDPLIAMRKDCYSLDLGNWFDMSMIATIGRIDGLEAEEVVLIHYLACAIRPR